jgi:hypothetical protein
MPSNAGRRRPGCSSTRCAARALPDDTLVLPSHGKPFRASRRRGLPDPAEVPTRKEVAKTYAEVAERASKLITEHVQRQLKQGIAAPADELGIAQAFMDMMAKLLANPYKLAQAQMNLVWDYFSLWQHSMLRFAGRGARRAGRHPKGDNRFKDEEWEEHFLFDFIKQSYLITARHIHDTVSNVEGPRRADRRRRSTSSPASTSTRCRRRTSR